MERVARLVGIGLLVWLTLSSVGLMQRTVASIEDEPSQRPPVTSPRSAGALAAADGQRPRYLAFSDGLPSAIYRVADLPSSRDRDITPSARGRDTSYPIETDIFPQFTLAGSGQVTPGLYATAFGVRDCSFELRQVMKTRKEAVIGRDHLKQGRMLVTINEIEPDSFSAVPQCGDWIEWSPLVEPLTAAGDGDYWIGDLRAGRWTVPIGCLWEKVVGFRGAKLWDVEDSGIGPAALVVDEDTLGVRIRNCPIGISLAAA